MGFFAQREAHLRCRCGSSPTARCSSERRSSTSVASSARRKCTVWLCRTGWPNTFRCRVYSIVSCIIFSIGVKAGRNKAQNKTSFEPDVFSFLLRKKVFSHCTTNTLVFLKQIVLYTHFGVKLQFWEESSTSLYLEDIYLPWAPNCQDLEEREGKWVRKRESHRKY